MRLRKPKVEQPEQGLTPERQQQIEALAYHIRMNGRRIGEFGQHVGEAVRAGGRPWPTVIEHPETGTTEVPAEYEGLLALVASYDSLLLDEELAELRAIVALLVPMGLNQQVHERRRIERERAHEEHMRENHPEEWEDSQGWMV